MAELFMRKNADSKESEQEKRHVERLERKAGQLTVGLDWLSKKSKDLAIDKLHLAHPYYGSSRLLKNLHALGFNVGRGRTRRLMHAMGITAIYRSREKRQGGLSRVLSVLAARSVRHEIQPNLVH